MTDRELLEAAARAAGLGEVWYLEGSTTPYIGPRYKIGEPPKYSPWKPHQDVGDAIRLVLRLGMRVDYVGDQPCVDGVLAHGMTAEESFCRAAVRAAAAMAPEES